MRSLVFGIGFGMGLGYWGRNVDGVLAFLRFALRNESILDALEIWSEPGWVVRSVLFGVQCRCARYELRVVEKEKQKSCITCGDS